jgi:hypothetical protein
MLIENSPITKRKQKGEHQNRDVNGKLCFFLSEQRQKHNKIAHSPQSRTQEKGQNSKENNPLFLATPTQNT